MSRWLLRSLSEAPDLAQDVLALSTEWPEFVLHDPVGRRYEHHVERFLDWTFAIVDERTGVVGRVLGVPLFWDQPFNQLPSRGWDAAIECALSGTQQPNVVCLLEMTLMRRVQRSGISRDVLIALKNVAQERGFLDLIAPVRPTQKSSDPLTSMEVYVSRCRSDGTLADSWLRTHVDIGGKITCIAQFSMCVLGTFEDWRAWTGLDLADAQDPVIVDGGLTPILVSRSQRVAVYVEPNVWVHHDCRSLQT